MSRNRPLTPLFTSSDTKRMSADYAEALTTCERPVQLSGEWPAPE